MKLEKTTYRIRCELGGCRNYASYTLRFERMGIRSGMHICEDCLKEVGSLIKQTMSKARKSAKQEKVGENESL